ncbi:hypothetical protein FNU76_01655 [Chitinimonas arctica]|uniref:Uncharacterized protein n=1 Tax=Chitinimonas arctica TaxID=2594795 RepID=A0A516SAI9_9NEIS|nr:hypothetical protein [Chitinimonas arctica]QDQ25165.1 hypothetical protein FNU76_01655 [Chitinimonas arctica]
MAFETPLDYYEAIAGELGQIFPQPWSSVWVEAERFADAIDLQIVYSGPNGMRESNVDPIMVPDYLIELSIHFH